MEELINNLFSHNNKIAYDSLKELEETSKESDEIYNYFEKIIEMLDSPNSYIRTRGIILISCNAKWDSFGKIDVNIDKYLEHIEDDKPITSRKCIQSLKNIIKYKKNLIPIIKKRLLELNYLKYDESMQSLLFKDVDDILKLMK